MILRLSVLLLLGSIAGFGAQSAVTLQTSPNPSTSGQAVKLTATVNPPQVTGRVTFYDGMAVLGTKTLTGGQAVLTSSLLPSGPRSLTAYYAGDSTYTPATSARLVHSVTALQQSGFAKVVDYYINGFSKSVAVGDFNGDGRRDVVIAINFSTSSTDPITGANLPPHRVELFAGNGDGSFKPAVGIATEADPRAVAVGDFNADGADDLALANGPGNNVSVVLANGNGAFQTAVNYNAGNYPQFIGTGDFNSDGKTDLVTTNYSGANVSVLLGNGEGSFQPATSYGTGGNPASIAVDDFNGDNKADLAVAVFGGVNVLLGNGTGTFQTASTYSLGNIPSSVAAGDFNKDGKPDLAVARSDSLYVLLGNGNGTFQGPVPYSTGITLSGVAAGDFDGDGNADLVTARENGPTDMLLGKGDGTFKAAVSYFVGFGGGSGIAVGDFNADGLPDLTLTDAHVNRLHIFLGASTPTFTTKNSASYAIGALAADTIAYGEGPAIARTLSVAEGGAWPASLAGVRMDITDSQGQTRPAPIYFVDVGAMSFLIPAGTAIGHAALKLTTSSGTVVSSGLEIERAAPGLFTANANGAGPPAGFWIRATANGAQSYDYLFDPGIYIGYRTPVPVDLGAERDKVFLSLYGTGFRNATQATATIGGVAVPVPAFAGVGQFAGEDVVNIGPLPRSLAGRGTVAVVLTFDGKAANTVLVSIQ